MSDDPVLGVASGQVRVVTHDRRWASLFHELRERLLGVLAGLDVVVEHIGSTSVPGLDAKPLLDVAVGLGSRLELDEVRTRLARAGFLDRGDWGDEGGIRFAEGPSSRRTAILHVVARSDRQWSRYLAFRDLLAGDAQLRDRYAELKHDLARRDPADRVSYYEGKRSFIESTIAERLPLQQRSTDPRGG